MTSGTLAGLQSRKQSIQLVLDILGIGLIIPILPRLVEFHHAGGVAAASATSRPYHASTSTKTGVAPSHGAISAVAIGASCLVLAALIAPVRARYDVGLNPDAPVSIRAAFLPVKLVAGDPRLREMAVTSFVYGGVQITLVTYLVTFLIDSFALSLLLAGAVMAVSQVASVLGRIVWGALADRAMTRRTMRPNWSSDMRFMGTRKIQPSSVRWQQLRDLASIP